MCPIAKLTAYYVHNLMLVFPVEYCQEGQSQNADGVKNTLSHFCGLVFAHEQGIQLECLLALARFRTTARHKSAHDFLVAL